MSCVACASSAVPRSKMKRPIRIILIYLTVSGVCSDITIEQPPIIISALGQNVTLPCHLNTSIDRMANTPVLYWVKEKEDQGNLWPQPSGRYQNRVTLLNQDLQSLDKSIRLEELQWEDKGIYHCKVSATTPQGSFRRKGSDTELLIYDRMFFSSSGLNNSQLQCEVPVSRLQGFTLTISHNDQILESSSGLNASALYVTLSQTVSPEPHGKYRCSLQFNGTLVTSSVYQDQPSGSSALEEYPQPWFLYGGLILVQLVFLLVMTIAMLRNSCT